MISRLEAILKKHQRQFASVLPEHLQHGKVLVLDMSGSDSSWFSVDLKSATALQQHTEKLLKHHDAVIAVGRYGEDRQLLYRRSPLFSDQQDELRSVHLGIDLSVPVNTPVGAPIAATVHSFQNNQTFGDYGPTIILQHELEGIVFYTLYGHLSIESLQHLEQGRVIDQGEQFAAVGDITENGGWPPHLHFQIIADMQGNSGDFPGVVTPSQWPEYSSLCPDPNTILQIGLKIED